MSSNPEIRVYHDPAELDEEAWARFVLDNEDGNVFQTPEMHQVFLETEHYEPVLTALVDENEEILGVMLGALIEEPGFITRRFSKRVVVYGGPIVSNHGDKARLLKKILNEHNTYVSRRAIFTEIRNLSAKKNLSPYFASAGYKYQNHLNVHIDLSVGEAELWNRLQRSRRKGIKKGVKSGLIFLCLFENDLDEIYSLIDDTYNRIRMVKPPKSLFRSVLQVLQERDLAKIFGSRLDGKLIAIQVSLTYRNVLYSWYSADSREYPASRANEYTAWHTMRWGAIHNYSLLDFGGAGDGSEEYGVRDYKIQFGGHLVDLGRFIYVHRRFMKAVSEIGLKAWRKLQ